jgi:hypothetical protein
MTAARNGRCEGCDVPEGSHELRRAGVCGFCQDFGLDLIGSRIGWPNVHVRCFAARYGIAELAKSSDGTKRARLCCLGVRRMGELLVIMAASERAS